MTESLHLSCILAATPMEVYSAWIDAEKHSAMTGGPATSDPRIGGKYTAWDGYIDGTHMTLEPGKLIIQTWKTTEFDARDGYSTVEVQLSAHPDGCQLILIQTDIPEGQTQYENGWKEHYFEPMGAYFSE